MFSVASLADASAKKYFCAKDCAVRYGISLRTWIRLVDSGRAPQPTHFGRLIRWSLAVLEKWEADGCKSTRKVGGAK